MKRRYQDLIKIENYIDRFEYLKLNNKIGDSTFGGNRYLNQQFYKSFEWKRIRQKVILRDSKNGFYSYPMDMFHKDHPIYGNVYIHHIEPITKEDLIQQTEALFDLDNLISVSFYTHQAIHYGDVSLLQLPPVIRKKNDTCPWK